MIVIEYIVPAWQNLSAKWSTSQRGVPPPAFPLLLRGGGGGSFILPQNRIFCAAKNAFRWLLLLPTFPLSSSLGNITCHEAIITNSKMVKYSAKTDNGAKAAKAMGTHIRVHFKHCREIANAIKGKTVPAAKSYLQNVLLYKEAIPFTKYTAGIGRHAAAKQYKTPGDKVAWPQKATKTFLDLLTNIASNSEAKGLDVSKVFLTHANCNQAPKMRRRTYRAHGRINAYMSCPAHISLVGEEKSEEIVKEKEEVKVVKRSKKQLAQTRAKMIKAGGGVDK